MPATTDLRARIADLGRTKRRWVEPFMDGRSATVTAVSNGGTSPTTITVDDMPPGFVRQCSVIVTGVGGATAVNGTWTATRTGWNTFTVPVANSTAFTTGGAVQVVSPMWTVNSGSATYNTLASNPSGTNPGTQPPGLTILSAAGTGDSCQLSWAAPNPLPEADLCGVFFTAEGLRLDAAASNTDTDFTMSLYGGGMVLEHLHAVTAAAVIERGGSSLTVPINYQINQVHEAQTLRTLTVAVIPQQTNNGGTGQPELWVLEGDPIADPEGATFIAQLFPTSSYFSNSAALNPNIKVTTQSSTAHGCSVSQLSVTVVHN